jgi:hypothetical protein
MKKILHLTFSMLIVCWISPLSGCNKGNPNAPSSVSGKVTYNNEPVTAGNVKFYTSEGAEYNCAIKPDGTYSGTDMPAGDLVVVIETESANKDIKKPTYGGGGGMQSPVGKPGESAQGGGAYVKIPKKYSDKKTSGLKETLSKGKNTKNFDLAD